MAKRIPDLTALSGAGSANDDNLVIFDTDANETKRILRSQLADGLVGDLPYTPAGFVSATTIPTAIAEIASDLAASSGSSLLGYNPVAASTANTAAAELRVAQAQCEHLWRAIRNNQRDIYLLVTGDSTGNEVTEWVYLMTQWLATQCPTHTIKYRLFNDGSTAWDTYTTIQTGTGPALPFTSTPFTIHIDNGSVSGTNTFYTQGGREAAFWTGNDYDLVIVNYGHNLGTGQTEAIAMPEWVVALSHVRLMAPRAGLLVTLQNPRSSVSSNINTNGSAQSARMTAAWRKAADLVGAGVIDVYTAFATNPNYASLMADETHPSPAGSAVWLAEVQRVMAEPIRLTGDPVLNLSPLTTDKPNFAPNPRFSSWIGSTPDGWTFTNCTATKDTGVSEGGLYSLRITAGAGTSPAVTADVSNYMPALRGKTVTFCARVWRPAGLGLLAGRIEIGSTDNVSSSASFVSYPRGTPSQDGWEWAQATLTIPRTHTQLTLRIYAGAADGSDNGESMYVDSVWFGQGWLPGQASLETAADKFVSDFYAAGNVGRITGNTGTLTVVGTTITLVGSPSTNSDVYINLPGLTPGQQYAFTFNADSCTGNTAGGIYVRNGFNGGFTTITTGTWTVGSPSTTTFTAPNGPVSLWVYGYTGATGWQISATSVRAVSPTFLNIPIGNLAFSGTAQRITGDFSNATWANRLAFQTSTVNGSTSVPVLPNGTGTASQIALFGNSDPTNASYAQLVQIGATETRLTAAIQGTGTYTPLTFYTGGSEAMRIDTSRRVGIGGSPSVGGVQLTILGGGTQLSPGTTAQEGLRIQRATGFATLTGINNDNNAYNGLQFFTSASAAVTVDTSGNVGIGTASPGGPLSIHRGDASTTIGGSSSVIKVNNSNGTLSTTAGIEFFATADLTVNTGRMAGIYGVYSSFNAAGIGGALVFATNTPGDATIDERMRIDSSGNVGIGTGSPNGKLEVSNSAATHTVFQLSQTNTSYNTDLLFYNAANTTSNTIVSKRTDGGLWLYQSGADYIAAYTSGTERMRIDSSGNVGIGDTSPSSRGRFSVLATTGAGRQFVVTGAGLTQARFDDNNLLNVLSLQNYGITAASQGVGILWSLGDSSANANDAGSIQVGSEGTWGATAASRDSFMRFSTTLDGNINERMRIDSSGNVGIGTAPSYTFDVYRSGTNTSVIVARNDNSVAAFYSTSSSSFAGTSTNTPFGFITNNSERMRIDASGNINVATLGARITADFSNATVTNRVAFQTNTANSATSVTALPNGSSTDSNFTVSANSDPTNASVGQLRASSSAVVVASTRTGSGTFLPLQFQTSGAVAMTVNTGGNVVQGISALSTTATDGFLWITSCAGAPTGAPTAPYTNAAALICDTTNNRLYVRVAGTWRYATLT